MSTAPGSQPSSPTYLLLGSDACNTPLPQNPIVRELSFGRFIALVDTTFSTDGPISGTTRKVVLPLHFLNVFLASRGPDPDPYKRALPVLDAAVNDKEQAAPVQTVRVTSVADLLSSRSLSLRGEIGEVSLNKEAVGQLLAGGTAVVPLKGVRGQASVRLSAAHAADIERLPLPSTHVVTDVHEFLAQPAVTDAYGKRVPVRLEPEQVRQLLKKRSVQLTANDEPITIVPAESSPDSCSVPGNAPLRSAYAVRSGPGESAAPKQTDLLNAIAAARREMVLPADESVLDLDVSSPQLGFYIPYAQTWTILGYSQGALLNSIALAPQEETTIELFSWDKRTNALEQTSASEAEQNIESVDTTKDTTQIANELTKDNNFHADASTDMRVNVNWSQAVSGSFGGMAGAGGTNTSKDVAKQTTDVIHEATHKASMRVRASRQSKVSESREFGSEQRTTRKVRNANMCRSLNLDYFEILVNYSVQTVCRRQEAQLVVLVEMKKRYQWCRTTVRKFEPTLKAVLLDRTFSAGFDACRLLAARDEAFKIVCERATCGDESTPSLTDSAEFAALRDSAYDVLAKFYSLRSWSNDLNIRTVLEAVAPPDPDNPGPGLPDMAAAVHRWAFAHRLKSIVGGLWSSAMVMIATGMPASSAAISEASIRVLHVAIPSGDAASTLAGVLKVDNDARQELLGAVGGIAAASGIYENFDGNHLNALSAFLHATIPGFDPASIFARFVADLVIKLVGQATDAAAIGIAAHALDARYNLGLLDDLGLLSSCAAFNEAYKAWTDAKQSMLKQSDAVANALDTLANERNDQIRNAFPLSAVAEAREREQALLLHLKEYDNYYSFALYQAQLNSGAIDLPLVVKQSNGLISSNVMGLVDGKLAFPVNLDGGNAADPNLTKLLLDFLNSEIRQNTSLDVGPDPIDIPLPTPGITLETRLGKCCACESFIEESRKVDLRQRVALARQAESEATRMEQRLTQATPNLDDPTPNRHDPTLTIKVEQQPPADAAGTTKP